MISNIPKTSLEMSTEFVKSADEISRSHPRFSEAESPRLGFPVFTFLLRMEKEYFKPYFVASTLPREFNWSQP